VRRREWSGSRRPPGGLRQSAARVAGQAASAVGHLLAPAPGVLGPSNVTLVVDRHLLQLSGQQHGVDDGGEPLHGAGAVLALPAGQGAEGFDERVGGRRQRGGLVAVGGRGQRLPHGVCDVGEGGLGEPAKLDEVEVAGQPQPLPQDADQYRAVGPVQSSCPCRPSSA
jgi:hypothetical protein